MDLGRCCFVQEGNSVALSEWMLVEWKKENNKLAYTTSLMPLKLGHGSSFRYCTSIELLRWTLKLCAAHLLHYLDGEKSWARKDLLHLSQRKCSSCALFFEVSWRRWLTVLSFFFSCYSCFQWLLSYSHVFHCVLLYLHIKKGIGVNFPKANVPAVPQHSYTYLYCWTFNFSEQLVQEAISQLYHQHERIYSDKKYAL